MFDRYTDRSRKVMGFARQEAERFNHDYIGTEHILLGLLADHNGVAITALQGLGVNLERARVEVLKLVKHGPEIAPVGQLPFTPRAKKVLEYTADSAKLLDHNYVGTEHLLLGLLREGEGVAHQVLSSFGLTARAVREETMRLVGPTSPAVGVLDIFRPEELDEVTVDNARDWVEKITVEARKAVKKFNGKSLTFNMEEEVNECYWPEIKRLFKEIGWAEITLVGPTDNFRNEFSFEITLTKKS
jgi:ATP-dependent Clp protease ATP-binding subunit ClpA